VTGHGPATARDLAYWATLGLRDVSRGLAAAADRLSSFEHDNKIYWHAADSEPPTSPGRPAGTCCSRSTSCTTASRTRGT
jgi:hypothetical protein